MPASGASQARSPIRAGWASFGLLLGSRGVSLAAGVAFVAITARLFAATEVALLAWASIASGAVETLRGFGLTNVLIRRLPAVENRDEMEAWITTHFLYASVPLYAAPLICAPFLPAPWMLICISTAFQLITNNHISVYQAMGRFRAVSVAAIASTVAFRVVPLAAAWSQALDLQHFLAWQAICGLPVCAGLQWHLRDYLCLRRRLAWREFWPQARAFYATGFVRYLSTQADQIFVALLFTPATLAPYFLVRRLYSAVVMVLSAGVDVLVPELGRNAAAGIESVRAEQAAILQKASLLLAVAGCLVAANAGWLVPMVVGPAYSAPRYVVPSLIAAAISYGLFSFALAGELVAGPPKETLRLVSIASAVPFVATPLLMGSMGVAALPLALATGYCCSAAIVLGRHTAFRRAGWIAAAGLGAVGLLGVIQESGSPLSSYFEIPSRSLTPGLNLLAVAMGGALAFVARMRRGADPGGNAA